MTNVAFDRSPSFFRALVAGLLAVLMLVVCVGNSLSMVDSPSEELNHGYVLELPQGGDVTPPDDVTPALTHVIPATTADLVPVSTASADVPFWIATPHTRPPIA